MKGYRRRASSRGTQVRAPRRQEVENQVARQARSPTTRVEMRRDFDHVQRHNAWLTRQDGHRVSELCWRESTDDGWTDARRVRAVEHVHTERNVDGVAAGGGRREG